MLDLLKELPQSLPLAVDWAESRSREILETGSPLTPKEQRLASSVGVRRRRTLSRGGASGIAGTVDAWSDARVRDLPRRGIR